MSNSETWVPITNNCRNVNPPKRFILNKAVDSGDLASEPMLSHCHLQSRKKHIFSILFSKLVFYGGKRHVTAKSADEPAKEIAATYLRRAALHFHFEKMILYNDK